MMFLVGDMGRVARYVERLTPPNSVVASKNIGAQ
jgi:hypothetical protein